MARPEPPYRIAILGTRFGPPDIEQEELAEFEVELVTGAATTAAALVAAAGEAVAILAGAPPQFNREVLAQLPNCRAIVRYGVGVDSIDLQAATELGIIIGYVPDYCTEEVSTHTLALILACERKLITAHQGVMAGEWKVAPVKPLFSAEEQTLGIIGFGKIGQAVARKAQPFGFDIIVFDPFATPALLTDYNVQAVELPELLAQSDIISLHAPLMTDTYHLIDGAALAQMKPTAFLINTSRGGLIDEAALLEALDQGRLAGAALDVLEREPPEPAHPLLQSDKLLVTPHMAWYTEQSAERMRRLATQEVARVLRGEWPQNFVNPEVRDVLEDHIFD